MTANTNPTPLVALTFTHKIPKAFPIKHRGNIVWRAVKTITETSESGETIKRVINATRATPHEAQWALMQRLNSIAQPDTTMQTAPLFRQRKKISENCEQKETIDQHLQEYLEAISQGEGAIRMATTKTYRECIKAILRPELGLTGTALIQIDAEAIRKWRTLLSNTPTLRTGKPVGTERYRKLNTFLNAALAAGVANGKIPTNPMAALQTPEDKRRAKVASKTEQQRKAIKETAENVKDRIYWQPQRLLAKLKADFESNQSDWASTRLTYVALSYLGLRPQEILGLTIDKLSFSPSAETITIAQTLSGSKIVNATKTPAGTRTLPLVEPWLSILKEQIQRRKAATGKADARLLATATGAVFRQQNLNTDYNQLLTECKMEYARLYLNRHITTSILEMITEHNLTIISAITGWEKPNTMLKVYGHYGNDEAIKQAITDLGKFITSAPMREVA